jgi:hypothetical protein
MTIEKHLIKNITYVAWSEETSFENETSTGSNDRNSSLFSKTGLDFEVASEWLNWDLQSC